MPEESFHDNLLRMIAALLYQDLTFQTAREMFGKSYLELGVAQRAVLDQTLFQSVAAGYQGITPERLKAQQKQQAGFQAGPTESEKK